MPNTIIPAKDVGKVFLNDFHKAMAKNFPKLKKDTKKYNKTMGIAIKYTLGGLFTS